MVNTNVVLDIRCKDTKNKIPRCALRDLARLRNLVSLVISVPSKSRPPSKSRFSRDLGAFVYRDIDISIYRDNDITTFEISRETISRPSRFRGKRDFEGCRDSEGLFRGPGSIALRIGAATPEFPSGMDTLFRHALDHGFPTFGT